VRICRKCFVVCASLGAAFAIAGCAGSSISRNFGFTPAGKFDVASCSAACVEKLSVGDGERCIKFTRAMADVCFAERDKVVPRGTLVLTKDP